MGAQELVAEGARAAGLLVVVEVPVAEVLAEGPSMGGRVSSRCTPTPGSR